MMAAALPLTPGTITASPIKKPRIPPLATCRLFSYRSDTSFSAGSSGLATSSMFSSFRFFLMHAIRLHNDQIKYTAAKPTEKQIKITGR